MTKKTDTNNGNGNETSGAAPAPLSLRVTREAAAALDALDAAAPGIARHRLAVVALEFGARALAGNSAVLCALLTPAAVRAIAAEAGEPKPAPVAEQEPDARSARINAIAAEVARRGGSIVTTVHDLASALGYNSNSVGQLLHYEGGREGGAFKAEKLSPVHTVADGFRTRWQIALHKAPAAPAPPTLTLTAPAAKQPRRDIDAEYDRYFRRVADAVAAKPGATVEWTSAEMTRAVKGAPGNNNRGVGNALGTMARTGKPRSGLTALKVGERGKNDVFRLTATDGAKG